MMARNGAIVMYQLLVDVDIVGRKKFVISRQGVRGTRGICRIDFYRDVVIQRPQSASKSQRITYCTFDFSLHYATRRVSNGDGCNLRRGYTLMKWNGTGKNVSCSIVWILSSRTGELSAVVFFCYVDDRSGGIVAFLLFLTAIRIKLGINRGHDFLPCGKS